jgi:cation diffusion facilitator CzcD-associated flavoprotein CzcO
MHAHQYMNPDSLAGKKVVVLGIGNSAMDIAVEASYVTDDVYLAARRGAHIVPKYLFGKPTDQLGGPMTSPRIPFEIRRRLIAKVIDSYVGDVTKFGLPKPDHEFGQAHPTVSGRILDRITHGAVTPKPNIRELDGREVVFEDGSRVEADVVVYCTGYKISFPFFDEDLISAPENHIELFRRVFHPDIPNVFFVGLLQPLGSVMPLSEVQGAWIAAYLEGSYALPGRSELLRDIAADQAAMQKRYVASKRHTIQVDFDDYLFDVARERRKGAERARTRGFALPVPRRAAAGEPAEVAA